MKQKRIRLLELDCPLVSKRFRRSGERFNQPLEFTPCIGSNITLLRPKLLAQPKLLTFRTLNGAEICVIYLDNAASSLKQLFDRLNQLNQQSIAGINDLMRELQDNRNSLFPQGLLTKNPNRAANAINEGKFLIMLEGEPQLLIMPVDVFFLLRPSCVSQSHPLCFLGLALLEAVACGLAMFLPALFVAVVTHDYYLIPANLIEFWTLSLLRAPLSPVVMALLAGMVLDLLGLASVAIRDAGTRIFLLGGGLLTLWGAVTSGLLCGGIAVSFGISVIAALAILESGLTKAMLVLKYLAIGMGAFFGILGVVVLASVTVAHIVSVQSLGQHYLTFKSLWPRRERLNFSNSAKRKERLRQKT